MALPPKRTKEKILPAIQPNAGTEALYRRKLMWLVGEMNKSVLYWIRAAYRQNVPRIAQDELPADELRRTVRRLARRWQRNFDKSAPKLAEYFAQSANRRSKEQLNRILKDAGFMITPNYSMAVRDVVKASVAEQVSLIKSIPQKYFTEVEGIVMRGVQNGLDLQAVVKDLGEKVDLKRIGKGRKPGESDKSLAARTQRRAAFIARDQTNKMLATITRARQIEAGIEEAVWVHGASREPRPTHLAAGQRGQRFDPRVGWFDPAVGRHVQPGELVNCSCLSRPVIPGF